MPVQEARQGDDQAVKGEALLEQRGGHLPALLPVGVLHPLPVVGGGQAPAVEFVRVAGVFRGGGVVGVEQGDRAAMTYEDVIGVDVLMGIHAVQFAELFGPHRRAAHPRVGRDDDTGSFLLLTFAGTPLRRRGRQV
ncbi:hypothetical protein [Streptomyces zhihengii]